ncbi:MAG: hypothetical protein DWQ09_03660 [Proteobacteria bacterium]|nr:MAG: hypothetical protein DWQ09_03660 [Pseudomonadota bacterium]QKK11102.1 MAG: hypothetical protein HND59_05300 [Pseudomonadota bacterium]
MTLERRKHYRIEERLEDILAPVLSFSRTATRAALQLVRLRRERQELAFHWIEVVAHSSLELAFHLAERYTAAAQVLSATDIERWIKATLDALDHSGLQSARAELDRYAEYSLTHSTTACPVTLPEVRRRLEIFLRGLSGRTLHIEPDDDAYTDSEIIFLPKVIDRYPDRESNLALYRALTIHLWAQTRFGTWQLPGFLGDTTEVFDAARFWRMGAWEAIGITAKPGKFVDTKRLICAFNTLETARLDACIERELPGLDRALAALRAPLPPNPEAAVWAACYERLCRPQAGVEDSYRMLATVYTLPAPTAHAYQSVMRPEVVERVRERRIEEEETRFRKWFAESGARAAPTAQPSDTPLARSQHAEGLGDESNPVEFLPQTVDVLAAPGRARSLMDSILQDLGELPRHYMEGEGDGLYLWSAGDPGSPGESDRTTRLPEVRRYPEWDYIRQDYHHDWCSLVETDTTAGDADFVLRTCDKYQGVLKTLKRTFALLREEDRLLRRQREGDEVDVDALVDSWSDQRRGAESAEGLYVKRHKLERDIAVLFMVDMSGSTKGWVNEAERESLVLLCESLEMLDDRYAVYGFSGMTRQRCEIYRIKRFDDAYDQATRERIAGVRPGEYTRMGVAIRHLTQLLGSVDARVRLLVTITDGKPDDFDGYRGKYGIEDTRRALGEAMESGLHTFCITLDREAQDYLAHLYGPANFAVVSDVASLPYKVADTYRRITT